MSTTQSTAQRYESDMQAMIDKAYRTLLRDHPRVQVYTVSIWTDPEARVSAVAIDTKAHSDRCVKRHIASRIRDAKRYPELYAAPSQEELEMQRMGSPADFKFPRMATRCHYWHRGPFKWSFLRPVLRRVQSYAIRQAVGLRIHEDARISINSSQDWYDHERPLHK